MQDNFLNQQHIATSGMDGHNLRVLNLVQLSSSMDDLLIEEQTLDHFRIIDSSPQFLDNPDVPQINDIRFVGSMTFKMTSISKGVRREEY